jgi:uncharacterized membrane protein
VNVHTWLLFLHVTGAIVWIGSGAALLVLQRLLVRADERGALLAIARQEQALGNRLFMPAALATLVAGVAMVALSDAFRFSDLWILVGFGGIALSAVAQTGIAAPAGRRFTALLEAPEGDRAELERLARRMHRGSTLDVAVLLVVVWAMIVRPTL